MRLNDFCYKKYFLIGNSNCFVYIFFFEKNYTILNENRMCEIIIPLNIGKLLTAFNVHTIY